MEDWNITILSNPKKLEKYLDKLNNKDQKIVNETLFKIRSKLLNIDNYNLNENNIHESFFNQFSPKLMNYLLSSDKEEMINILSFYLNILVENLDKLKFFPFLKKITKILNKKELFHGRSDVTNIQTELIEEKSANKSNENSFYESLNFGSVVDYFYVQLNAEKSKEIGLWTRAEVIEVSSNLKGKIKLLGLGLIFEINFVKPYIVPVNTYSHDYDWRNSLKKDDLIDVYLNETWNLCIITDIPDKSKIAKYRILLYSGNDETFQQSLVLNVFSPVVRKPNLFSKTVINNKFIKEFPYDFKNFNLLETFNEFDENSQRNVIPSNFYCHLKKSYFDLINIVSNNKSLEKMIKILSTSSNLEEKKECCNLFLEIILPINKFLYHDVAKRFYNDFLPLVRSVLSDFMIDEYCETERLIKIFNNYAKLLKRHYIISDYKRECYCFYLDCIESFLMREPRKNEELAFIFELFETNVINLEFREILLDELGKRNIKDLIFLKIFASNFDVNLLQISSKFVKKLFILGYFTYELEDICKFLLNNQYLKKYKKEIYRFLTEIGDSDPNSVKFIVTSILDRVDIGKNEIILINNLYHQLIMNFLQSQEENKYDYILSILISYYFDEKCDKETRNLLKSNFNKLEEFTLHLPLIFDAINSHPMPIKCLSKLRKLYSDIDTIELKKKLIEEFKYINIVINGYEKYHNDMKLRINNKRLEINDPKYNYFDNYPNTKKAHEDLVREVFYSLSNFVVVYKDTNYNRLSLQEVGFDIFFELFVQNPLRDEDVFSYAHFLSESENLDNYQYFNEKYGKIMNELTMKKTNFDELLVTFKEFEDIWNLFIRTNILDGKIRTISSKSKFTNIFLFSKISKDNEILNVLCHSSNLLFIDFLWNHIIRLKELEDKKFSEEIMSQNAKFIQLFLFNNEELVKDVTNWEYFLSMIFSTLNKINEKCDYKHRSLVIKNILNILYLFITKTEVIKLGVYSHSSLVTHSILNIPFSNQLTNRYHRTSLISNVRIRCASNCTVWDIKVQLGRLFGIIPEIITIDKASSEINIEENGRTVRESFLNLEKHNKVMKSKLFSKFPREPLVNNNECTPKFVKVLTEIFELYSTDNRLSIENFIEFIKTCVDEDIIKYNDKRIKMFLDKYDLDKDLLVSLESLIKFYLYNEKEKNGVIWSNLYNFNIKNDLKNLDIEYDNFKIDKRLFPRYSISTKTEYFDILYDFNSSEKEILNLISEILFALTTNKSVFMNTMIIDSFNLNENDINFSILEDKWNLYLFLDSPIKFHYNLNIIFSLFTSVLYENEKLDIQRDLSYLIPSEEYSYLLELNYSKKYIEVFLKTGGINIMIKVKNALIKNFLLNWEKFNENCIMLVMNLLIFIFSLFHFSSIEKMTLVQNLKLNFSNLVKIFDYGQFKFINPVPSNFFDFKHVEVNDEVEDKNNEFWFNLAECYKDKILENIDFTKLVSVLINILVNTNHKKEWKDKDRNIFNTNLNLIHLISEMKSFNLQSYLFQNSNLFRELLFLPSGFSNQINYLNYKLNHLLNNLIDMIPNKTDLSCLCNITEYLSKEIFDENKQIISFEMAKTYTQILSIHINDENSKFDFKTVFDNIIKYLKNNRFNSKLKCYLDVLKIIIPKIQQTENISDLIILLDSIVFNNENLKFKVFDDEEIRKSILESLVEVINFSEKYHLDIIFQTNFSKLPQKTKELKRYSSDHKERKINNFVVLSGDFLINSVVQSLYFLRSFKKIIFSVKNVEKERQRFLYNFQRMFSYLDLSQRRYFDIESDYLHENVKVVKNSSNLLLIILQNLRIDLEQTEYKYLIDSYFGGKFVMKEECTICKNKSLFLDKFLNLEITIDDQNTVKELYEYIESTFFTEKLLNKNCLACGGRISSQKYIYDLPNYLIITFRDARNEERKEVTINKKLDLKYDINYIYNSKEKYIKIRNPDTNHEEELLIYERDDLYYQYELVSAIKYDRNEFDSSNIEISLNEIQNEINDCDNLSLFGDIKPRWIEFYDDNVNSSMSKEIKTTWVEPLINGENVIVDNPLIFIYEKKKRNPIKIVERETDIIEDKNSVVRSINKNNKNLLKKSLDIFSVDNLNYISKKEAFFDNLYLVNDKTNEITYYSFFENLKFEKENKGLQKIIEEINKDNFNFDIERMIFGKYFSKFLESFICFSVTFCNYNKETGDKTKLKKLFKLCLELFYEIPMKNCEIPRFNTMVKYIGSIVNEIPVFSKYIVKELYKRKNNIFNVLTCNKDDQIQTASQMISSNLAENLKEKSGNNEKIKSNIYELLDLILIKSFETTEYQYLIILEQLVKTNSLPILAFLFKNQILSKLLSHFTNSKEKSFLKTSLSLISLLVSYCETETWTYEDMKNKIIPSTFSAEKIKPFKLTIIERYYLYSKNFYEKIIDSKIFSDIKPLVKHLMFRNASFSKIFVTLMYDKFNNFENVIQSPIERKDFILLLAACFSVDDEYLKLRFQYFFGIPQLTEEYLSQSEAFIYYDYVSPDKFDKSFCPTTTILKLSDKSYFIDVFENLYNNVFSEVRLFKYLNSTPSVSKTSSKYNNLFCYLTEEINSKINYIKVEKESNIKIQNLYNNYIEDIPLPSLDRFYSHKRIYSIYIKLLTIEELKKKDLYLFDVYYCTMHWNNEISVLNEFDLIEDKIDYTTINTDESETELSYSKILPLLIKDDDSIIFKEITPCSSLDNLYPSIRSLVLFNNSNSNETVELKIKLTGDDQELAENIDYSELIATCNMQSSKTIITYNRINLYKKWSKIEVLYCDEKFKEKTLQEKVKKLQAFEEQSEFLLKECRKCDAINIIINESVKSYKCWKCHANVLKENYDFKIIDETLNILDDIVNNY